MSDSDGYHHEAFPGPRYYGPTTADSDSDDAGVLTEASPLLRKPPTDPRPRFPSMASTLCPTSADPSAEDIEKATGRAPPPSPVPGESSGSQHERDSTTDSHSGSSPVSASRTPSQRASSTALKKRQRRALKRLSPSLTLENSGSVARDHLASERTFLAYVRTSLAIASTGVALVQLFTLSASSTAIKKFARPLGATTVALGFGILLVGFVRFFTVQSALTRGKFPVARVTVVGMGLALGTVVVVVFAVILAAAK